MILTHKHVRHCTTSNDIMLKVTPDGDVSELQLDRHHTKIQNTYTAESYFYKYVQNITTWKLT